MLRRWAALTSRKPSPARTDGMASLLRLIEVSRRRVTLENERVVNLLDESTRMLQPLSDPLVEDFGAHRWLRADREETYSDWLAWIFSRLGTAERILAVLGEDLSGGPWGQLEASVAREYPVEAGHIDQTGRVDIHLEFQNAAVIWIEVKLTSAEDADMKKNAGYRRSQEARHEADKRRFSIALSGSQHDYDGFEFRSWRTICVGLRRAALDLRRDDAINTAAMTLAFVGAVEQNVLGFPGQLRRRAIRGDTIWAGVEIADYLASWLSSVKEV
jgi:hypothetical protein